MTRMKTIQSIDAKIEKNKSALSRIKARYERLADNLKKLQDERQALEARAIMTAFKKSRKSFSELMTFLDG